MARTQAVDYEKKRDALMKEAAALFARSSFAGASVSELAARCGVSKSLVYHYYPSKEAILYDVMNGHMDALIEAVGEDDPSDVPDDALRAFTRKLLAVYVDAADPQKVLLYEIDNLPAEQRASIVAKQRRLIARVESLVVRARPLAAKDRAGLRARVMLYFGMLNWTHTWFRASGPISRDNLAEIAAETLLVSFR